MATKLVYCGLKANLPAVREQAFYLTTDSRELYFGDKLYTEPVRFVPKRETAPAQGVLYILPSGLGEVYDGSAWKTIIKPTVTKIEAGVTDEQVATAKAVKDYVDNLVTGGIGALGALAKKDEVTETELGDALKKKINDAAAQACRSACAGLRHDCRRRNRENRILHTGISEGGAECAAD